MSVRPLPVAVAEPVLPKVAFRSRVRTLTLYPVPSLQVPPDGAPLAVRLISPLQKPALLPVPELPTWMLGSQVSGPPRLNDALPAGGVMVMVIRKSTPWFAPVTETVLPNAPMVAKLVQLPPTWVALAAA